MTNRVGRRNRKKVPNARVDLQSQFKVSGKLKRLHNEFDPNWRPQSKKRANS